MEPPKTEEELDWLIENEIQESHTLEYKSAGALARDNDSKTGITKDVSALANAEGGILIYGVKEYDDKDRKNLPEAITPIDATKYPKEWLGQIIDQIRPKVDAKIYPVMLKSAVNHTAYVVEVLKGETAYQAIDGRYYQRRNFFLEIMLDYQIRDVMNRRRFPMLSVSAYITSDQPKLNWVLHFQITNTSDILAQNFIAIIHMPFEWRQAAIRLETQAVWETLDDGEAYRVSFSNQDGLPLFPKSSRYENIKFHFAQFNRRPLKLITDIRYRVYADEMPFIEGRFDPDNIFRPYQAPELK